MKMLLTSLLPESVLKKVVALPDVSSSLETSNQNLSVRLQLLKKRLQKKRLLQQRRNSENSGSKGVRILRRFSFPLLQSKYDSDTEMDTLAKETEEGYNCALCQVRGPSSTPPKIWKTDKNCSCLVKDDINEEDIKAVIASITAKMMTDHLTGQQISDFIQDVYSSVDMRLQNAVWKGDISEDMAIERMNSFEKQLMRNLHCKLFNKILEEEEETDKNLSSKINCLHWVTARHLAAKVNESDVAVIELLHKAMLDIAAINFKESPAEKLECIMNCSRQIFALLKKHPNSTESADDYLPLLVYIVLQVNPSQLHSNIRYILLFSNSDRVVKGEEGYYFTHLCSVVSFIENISANSLNMSVEKFARYTASEGFLKNGSEKTLSNRSLATCICKVYNQAAEVEALKWKQDCLMERSISLQEQMKLLKDDILTQSIRSKISKSEICKFMASRQERSRHSKTDFLFHQLGRTTGIEVSHGIYVNSSEPVKSEINILQFSHHVRSEQEFQRKNLNGYCEFLVTATKTVELKIPPSKEQIPIFVPKNLLNDSTDVAFDVESYLIINDLKER